MSRRQLHSISGGVNLALIVTPMLDMSFQLLSFFIMVYSPNTGEEFIGGELSRVKSAPTTPDKATKGDIKKDTLPSSDPIPELTESYTIVLSEIDPALKGGAPPKMKGADKEGKAPRFVLIRTPADVSSKEKDNTISVDPNTASKDGKVRNAALTALALEVTDRLKTIKKETGGGEKAKDDPGFKVKFRIEADRDIQFQFIILVYAAAKAAGFEDVTFTSPVE